MNRTVFFVLNQNPVDGAAHSLYCLRHLLSLAQAAPKGWKVVLLHASSQKLQEVLKIHNLPAVENFEMRGLPHLRREKGGSPIQMNAVFYWAALLHLRRHAQDGDIISTASFSEMFRFLAPRLKNRKKDILLVYEVHQLESLSRPLTHKKCTREFTSLGYADHLITTCLPLVKILKVKFPSLPISNLGLASTYIRKNVYTRQLGGPLRIGYFGSASEEQGIPWLVKEWANICSLSGAKHSLHIYGRARRGETVPESNPLVGVHIYAPVPSDQVPLMSESLDALIIPSLDMAHRASIAFTKAYDYAGLALPIFASDLPTIHEVLPAETDALFFTQGSATELAQCIKRLAENPNLGETMIANLKKRASSFSWQQRAERWWALFAHRN